MPTYLHTSLLTCLLAYLLSYIPAYIEDLSCQQLIPTTQNHTLGVHLISTDPHLVSFKFKIYLPGFGGSPLSIATPSYPMPPKITKQTIYQLPTVHMWPISSCISTFPGMGEWVVIIILKANLSSTSHLTSQLDLSLAIMMIIVATNIVASQLPERQQTGT